MARPNSHGFPQGITLHGNKYRVRVTFHGERHQCGEFYTLSDAKAALTIARSQVARDIFIPLDVRREQWRQERAARQAGAVTVRAWSADWLEGLRKAGRSPSTIASYKSTATVHVLPFIGDKRLGDVTSKDIEALALDASPGVAANIAATVSALFNSAVKAGAGGLSESPVKIKTGTYTKRRARRDEADAATVDDVRAIANNMPEPLRPAVWLAATCALRLGEVLGLQRRDLDLEDQDNAVLHVRRQWLTKASPPRYGDPKAGSARDVAIPTAIVGMLAQHLEDNITAAPESPVFSSTVDRHRPISQGSFDRAWRLAREPVRPGFRFHALRHVGLTWYAQQGATTEELLRRGGHTSVEVAQRYQSATAARDRTLTDKLDGELKKALG